MYIPYIFHLSKLLLLLVSDMFIIRQGKGYYKEAHQPLLLSSTETSLYH